MNTRNRMTLSEAADRLGRSVETVRSWTSGCCPYTGATLEARKERRELPSGLLCGTSPGPRSYKRSVATVATSEVETIAAAMTAAGAPPAGWIWEDDALQEFPFLTLQRLRQWRQPDVNDRRTGRNSRTGTKAQRQSYRGRCPYLGKPLRSRRVKVSGKMGPRLRRCYLRTQLEEIEAAINEQDFGRHVENGIEYKTAPRLARDTGICASKVIATIVRWLPNGMTFNPIVRVIPCKNRFGGAALAKQRLWPTATADEAIAQREAARLAGWRGTGPRPAFAKRDVPMAAAPVEAKPQLEFSRAKLLPQAATDGPKHELKTMAQLAAIYELDHQVAKTRLQRARAKCPACCEALETRDGSRGSAYRYWWDLVDPFLSKRKRHYRPKKPR